MIQRNNESKIYSGRGRNNRYERNSTGENNNPSNQFYEAASSFTNSTGGAVTSLGAEFIKSKSSEYLEVNRSFIRNYISGLNEYFDINDKYVADKIKLILFPFHKDLDFLYKPDLYLPIVSLLTYLLIYSISLGISHKFHPEMLFKSTTNNVTFIVLFSLFYKGILYFGDCSVDNISLVCFVGYKFVVLSILKLLRLFISTSSLLKPIYIIILVYSLITYFLFFSRSLHSYMITNHHTMSFHEKRKYVFFLSATEIAVILFYLK